MEKVGGWQSQERWMSTRNQRRDFPTQVPSTQPLTQPLPRHAKEHPVITVTTVVLNLDTVPRSTPTFPVCVCLLQLVFDISAFHARLNLSELSEFTYCALLCRTVQKHAGHVCWKLPTVDSLRFKLSQWPLKFLQGSVQSNLKWMVKHICLLFFASFRVNGVSMAFTLFIKYGGVAASLVLFLHPESCIRDEWKNHLATKQNECVHWVVVSKKGIFLESASGKGKKKIERGDEVLFSYINY